MKYHFHLALLFGLSLCLLSSCKSRKKGLSKKEHSKEEVFQALENHNIDYEWFTAEGKVKITVPDQYIPTVKVYLRIEREKAIWMVVKKLNIEVARALITPEKFTILYRFENVYEEESLKTLLDSYNTNLSFTELQDYLVGNIPKINKEGLQFRKNGDQLVCQTIIEGFKSFLRLDAMTMQLNNFELYNQKNESVKGEYSNFELVNEQMLPFKRSFDIYSMEHGNLKASFNLSEIQVNEAKSMKFSVPSHYDKLKYYRPF